MKKTSENLEQIPYSFSKGYTYGLVSVFTLVLIIRYGVALYQYYDETPYSPDIHATENSITVLKSKRMKEGWSDDGIV